MTVTCMVEESAVCVGIAVELHNNLLYRGVLHSKVLVIINGL